jgi:hypothetical protein
MPRGGSAFRSDNPLCDNGSRSLRRGTLLKGFE